MEISQEKSKTMVNSKNNYDNATICMDGILEDVKTFKYLGANLKSSGSSDNELRIRLATATYAMIIINVIWTIVYCYSKSIRLQLKFNLYRSLVLSITLRARNLEANVKWRKIIYQHLKIRRLLEINYHQMKINARVKDSLILNW